MYVRRVGGWVGGCGWVGVGGSVDRWLTACVWIVTQFLFCIFVSVRFIPAPPWSGSGYPTTTTATTT